MLETIRIGHSSSLVILCKQNIFICVLLSLATHPRVGRSSLTFSSPPFTVPPFCAIMLVTHIRTSTAPDASQGASSGIIAVRCSQQFDSLRLQVMVDGLLLFQDAQLTVDTPYSEWVGIPPILHKLEGCWWNVSFPQGTPGSVSVTRSLRGTMVGREDVWVVAARHGQEEPP